MLALTLSPDVENRLTKLAKAAERDVAELAAEALAEWLESEEDYLLAKERLATDKERFTLEELEREFGVAR